MIKEAIDRLVELGKGTVPITLQTIDGRNYTDKSLVALKDPTVTAIKVSTLSGLRDLIQGKFEDFDAQQHIVHVVDHEQVQVVTNHSNDWKDRQILIDCKAVLPKQFQFDQFLNHETFVIGLLSSFVDAGDREMVLKLASNVTAEAIVTSADDGVSQQIAVKRGVSLKEAATIRTVKLAPFRTFREIEQPLCEFALRAKQATPESLPQLALFDADGGKWKLAATESIARKLRTELPAVTVVS